MGPKSNHDDWNELWRGVKLAAVTLCAAIVTATGVIAGGHVVLAHVLGEPTEAEASQWLSARNETPVDVETVRLTAP